ncbi:AAA family ATPase [Microbacterium sp. gxy059]|uniref:AAA family ATPase n=1 Tax=Microbacterium sp. gxy059 TaxID=2957199 RepID=UPI003D9892DD
MRIHRIEIEGFGPFRRREQIDLDAYAADGIFLIAGRTGAGKSSILDAVCFALYGTTPRSDDGEKRLRSDHADPGEATRVAVEFSLDGTTWRIERSPEYERPKLRGTGMTTEPPRAEMFERVDGEWIGRAARAVDVAQLVTEVIGLTHQQFLQVILLAQGRFARFLLAKNDERRQLLRTLFGTRRFQSYEQALDERRKQASAEAEQQEQSLRAVLDQADSDIAALDEALQERTDVSDARRDGTPFLAADVAAEERASEAGREPGAAIGHVAPADASTADTAGNDPEEGNGSGGDVATGDTAIVDELAPDAETTGSPADSGTSALAGAETDPWTQEIARLAAAAARAAELADARDADAEVARAVRDAAESTRDALRRAADGQHRRDAARAALASLDAAGEETERRRAALASARRAASARGALDAADRAADAVTTATTALDRSRASWADESSGSVDGPSADAEPAALDAFVDETQQRIGSWQPLRERETQLAQQADRLEAQRVDLAALDVRIEKTRAQRAVLPERIQRTEESLEGARERAQRREAVDAHLRDLQKQFEAAQEVGDLAQKHTQADAADRAAREQRNAAEARLDALHARRLRNIAGELAADLRDDEPCPVCGSAEHPQPAERADEPVTADDIDAAEAARQEAASAAETAAVRRQEAQLALRDAEQRADGRTETEVSGDMLAARTQLAAAEDAAREKADYQKRLDDLRRAQEDLAAAETRDQSDRSALAARIDAAAADLARDRRDVDAARGSFDSVAQRIGRSQRLASLAGALADAHRARDRAEESARESAEARDAALSEAGFPDVAAARAALLADHEFAALEQEILDVDARRRSAEQTLAELADADLPAEPVDIAGAGDALAAARRAAEDALERRGAARRLADALASHTHRAREIHTAVAELLARAAVITRLADSVSGRAPNTKRMDLETYVLAAELEEIVDAANLRLAEMSGQRYALQHTDALARRNAASGLGIEIMDRFTGRARPPHSLSGGETFLASLALALGLAEVVTNRAGGIRLDTLFIDEGFGSLDAETLEVAMRTLDELRQGGRTIGIISHVEAMQEQIPAQLRVRQTPEGWSIVDQQTSGPA